MRHINTIINKRIVVISADELCYLDIWRWDGCSQSIVIAACYGSSF